MKFYEPIAVGIFVVTVLAAAYLLGKRIGYEQGFERANSDAFAEGHISGYNDAIDAIVATQAKAERKEDLRTVVISN